MEKSYEKPAFFPFCSERCKLVDLGKWLDSEYKVISKQTDSLSEDDIPRNKELED
jgi:uncharacterized protein